jgi:hypothetical protein
VPIGTEPALQCLWKGEIGHHWNIPISLPSTPPSSLIVVTMECIGSAAFRLFDRAGPIVGQSCRLFGSGFAMAMSHPIDTDDQGLVTFPKLSPGQYQLRVDAPDHWPFYKDFNATLDGEVNEVEIPRLAEMTVEVRKAHGVIVSGQEVRVWTVDYDKDTRYGQGIGVMNVVPADWKTDVTGRVHIPKFPEGS